MNPKWWNWLRYSIMEDSASSFRVLVMKMNIETSLDYDILAKIQWIKGMTLHSGLYSHPWPGSRSDPSNFCAWSLDHTENLALFSINHAHRAPGGVLTVSKLASTVCLITWPASKFGLDHLTSLWLWSWMGVQSPRQCHPLVNSSNCWFKSLRTALVGK